MDRIFRNLPPVMTVYRYSNSFYSGTKALVFSIIPMAESFLPLKRQSTLQSGISFIASEISEIKNAKYSTGY